MQILIIIQLHGTYQSTVTNTFDIITVSWNHSTFFVMELVATSLWKPVFALRVEKKKKVIVRFNSEVTF